MWWALLVYSIDDKNSFNDLSKWINKIREYNLIKNSYYFNWK